MYTHTHSHVHAHAHTHIHTNICIDTECARDITTELLQTKYVISPTTLMNNQNLCRHAVLGPQANP